MSACIVKKVTAVEAHPREDKPHLNVVRTADANFVSMKIDGVTPRYQVSELVIHIPHGAILTPELQTRLDTTKTKIKAEKFAGVLSEGMLMPIAEVKADAQEGDDVTALMGITF